MSRLSIFFCFCLAAALSSCSKSQSFRIKANLTGLGKTPILVIYDDPQPHIDTIYHDKGRFTYSFTPDTLTLMRLVVDSGEVIPVFADRGWRVNLEGHVKTVHIKGNGYNADYQSFLESVQGKSRDEAAQEAEAFIRSHPESFASAYLLEMYFVQCPEPDAELIEELIEPMAGEVKDTRIVGAAIKALLSSGDDKGDYLNVSGLRDRTGEAFHWTAKDAPMVSLIHFWASWDEGSMEERDEHEELLREFSDEEMRVVCISIDYERKEWEAACLDDNDQWIELCDFKGWNTQAVKGLDIRSVPYTVLVDKNRKVQGRDLHGEELKERALRLVQQAKDRAEKAEKKKNKSK